MLGELASFGSSRDTARPGTGEAESFYAGLAREHGLWLVPGSVYERAAEHVYNTALVINPAGETVGRYRKQFPFLPYETDVEAGADYVVFDIPGAGRVGVAICYDMWFPEAMRTLAGMAPRKRARLMLALWAPQDHEILLGKYLITMDHFVPVHRAHYLHNLPVKV